MELPEEEDDEPEEDEGEVTRPFMNHLFTIHQYYAVSCVL